MNYNEFLGSCSEVEQIGAATDQASGWKNESDTPLNTEIRCAFTVIHKCF